VTTPIAPVHEPPPIAGVRRSRHEARGVDFHVTEAGDPDGLPVLLLHGWPEHHYAWRHLLSDPPGGLRLIAPDLPGYGWSGAPPHAWFKQEIVSDMLALMDALALERVLLVGHDWGGMIGHQLVLRAPERVLSYLVLNMVHPWLTPRQLAPHFWRFITYQPALALFGYPLMRHTTLVGKVIGGSFVDRSQITREEIAWYMERFRDPVCARAGTDSYRTFWRYELPASFKHRELRRSVVPTLALFGAGDQAIHHSLASARTANADDYRLELVFSCGHFIAEERPALVRRRLLDLAANFT
jgi:pimeloyl-ACP methyl ester carboxylesterase